MRIVACEIDRYEAPLVKALPRTATRLRSGLYITLRLADGRSGTGEIAPLSGFSAENLDEAQAQTTELAKLLVGGRDFQYVLSHNDMYSSVRCGLELVYARLSAMALWWNPEESNFDSVEVCALLDPSPSRDDDFSVGSVVGTQIRRLISSEFARIKIKMAAGSVEDDIQILNAASEAIGTHGKIRLDANRRWSFDEAVAVLTAADTSNIEFLEDPLRDPADLPRLHATTGVPIALDESLNQFVRDDLNFEGLQWVYAIVLKPMLAGGYVRSYELANAAANQGIRTVISSSFETAVGHEALLRLSRSLPTPHLASGLDTQAYFLTSTVSGDQDVSLTRIFAV